MLEEQAVAVLGALAQLNRLRVFRAIAGSGRVGTTPSAVAEELGVAKNILSFHLKELAHAGLVSVEQKGRNLFYRANPELVSRLAGFVSSLSTEPHRR